MCLEALEEVIRKCTSCWRGSVSALSINAPAQLHQSQRKTKRKKKSCCITIGQSTVCTTNEGGTDIILWTPDSRNRYRTTCRDINMIWVNTTLQGKLCVWCNGCPVMEKRPQHWSKCSSPFISIRLRCTHYHNNSYLLITDALLCSFV